MGWLLDGVYGTALLAASPWLAAHAHRRRLLPSRILGNGVPPRPEGIVVWFHGVSVGEIILLETLLKAFRQARPDVHPIVSTSTDTGMAEALKRHASFSPFPFPFDFSFAVNKVLDALRPDLIVLAESELWPNFLSCVHRRGIPLAVINARMSPRSLKRWKWAGPVAKRLFPKVTAWATQQPEHAQSLVELGVDAKRVQVTGSVKFDHAVQGSQSAKVQELRAWLNLAPEEKLWVAGSTQPGEESLCLETFAILHREFPELRLAIVPRDPSRGAEIASLIRERGFDCHQRSQSPAPAANGAHARPVFVLDTIGELGALWNLASLALVGGSFDGKRGGQNMIEPAAQGLVGIFGQHVWNFQAIAKALVEGGHADMVRDPAQLTSVVRAQLADPVHHARRGAAAKAFVVSQQGATERTVTMLVNLLPKSGAGTGAPLPVAAAS